MKMQIISKEDMAKERYNKSFAKLSVVQKSRVHQEWINKLMGRK